HAALRRGVVHVARPGDYLVHGADADDLARAARHLRTHTSAFELAHGRTRTKELASEIHADHLVPLGERELLERHVLLETGVVHEDVDRAELGLHRGEHLVHISFARNVGTQSEPAATLLLDLGRDRPCLILARDVINDDICASLAERESDRSTDPRARTGHERLLTRQPPLRRAPGHHG